MCKCLRILHGINCVCGHGKHYLVMQSVIRPQNLLTPIQIYINASTRKCYTLRLNKGALYIQCAFVSTPLIVYSNFSNLTELLIKHNSRHVKYWSMHSLEIRWCYCVCLAFSCVVTVSVFFGSCGLVPFPLAVIEFAEII